MLGHPHVRPLILPHTNVYTHRLLRLTIGSCSARVSLACPGTKFPAALTLSLRAILVFICSNWTGYISPLHLSYLRWRKFVVRLQLENAALSSVRGILKIKVAQAKATKLALRFLDAIQCPRLLMNDGDDLRGPSLRPVAPFEQISIL